MEKAAFTPGQNVFFLVRNPGQFPGAIERIVERIQGYFSSYNSLDSLNNREKPHMAVHKNSSIAGQAEGSTSAGLLVTSETSTLPANSAKQVEINPTLNGAAGDPNYLDLLINEQPVSVYEITIGPDIVHEPQESYGVVPNQAPFVPVSYLPPVEESASLNEIHPVDGPSEKEPAAPLIEPLLPPYEESNVNGVYEPPCNTTTEQPPQMNFPPGNSDVNQNEVSESSSTATTEEFVSQEYLPPTNQELDIEGPYIYQKPSTTTTSFTTSKPVTTNILYYYQRPSTSSKPPKQEYPCNHSESTTTHKPTCKYSTTSTTTTPKPATVKPVSTTKTPCQTSSTTPKTPKPTTRPCQKTTTTPTTTTTQIRPCQTNTKPSTTKPPCNHGTHTEPSWSYLPPEKPSPPPNAYLPPAKPSYHPSHESHVEDYQPENHIQIHWRPFFRHRPRFLLPLKRFLGLA